MKTIIKLLAICYLPSAICFSAYAQGTAFTYQGRLNDGGSPATGIYDLRFTICDALTSGSVVGVPKTNSATGVTNGLFAVTLDFGGGVFTGSNRWVEIAARTNGAATFTALAPRQPIQPVPYAVMANTASNLLGNLPAAQLSGTLANGALPASPNFAGTVTAGSFTGNGANVTSLNANNLASGTVSLAQLSGITGSQLAAATWQQATNLNGGNAALATNVVAGIAITNAFITNSVFAGNGAGLTNLNASQLSGTITLAQLPAAVLTNNSANLTVGGTNIVAPLTVAPAVPGAAIGSVGTSTPQALAVAGCYAYVVSAAGNCPLQVFDVSTVTNPVLIGSVSMGAGSQPFSIAVAGRYAYVACFVANTLLIFDISTPSAPVLVGSATTGSNPISVAVAGRYAYVANNGGPTLQVFDVSIPSAPALVGSVGTGSGPLVRYSIRALCLCA
jgi:hypothetical protein